jgi:cytochrome c553
MKRVLALWCFTVCASSVSLGSAEPLDKGDPAKGQSVATQVCAACHGSDGNSPTPSNPNLAAQIPEYIRKQLSNFKTGPGGRPARSNPIMGGMVANLSDENIRDVAAYYAGQRAKPGTAKTQDTLALGRKIWRGGDASKGLPACAACHGASGAGLPAQYPRLAGQHAEYSGAQLRAFRAGERTNDPNKVMEAIASRMTDREILAVADYVAGLH